MVYKVRISYFDQAGLNLFDYPEEIVNMVDSEFDRIIEENQCYYDDEMDIYYTPDNNVGYSILEIL